MFVLFKALMACNNIMTFSDATMNIFREGLKICNLQFRRRAHKIIINNMVCAISH